MVPCPRDHARKHLQVPYGQTNDGSKKLASLHLPAYTKDGKGANKAVSLFEQIRIMYIFFPLLDGPSAAYLDDVAQTIFFFEFLFSVPVLSVFSSLSRHIMYIGEKYPF